MEKEESKTQPRDKHQLFNQQQILSRPCTSAIFMLGLED